MVIGTHSQSTIFDVFRTGIGEIIRQAGLPLEIELRNDFATIIAKSKDFYKRTDSYRIEFNYKEGVTAEQVKQELDNARIPNQVSLDNGKCSISLPGFEWPQMNQLIAADAVVQQFVVTSLRSLSWYAEIKQFKKIDFNINVLIEEMKKTKASDLHLRAGSPPFIRVDGDLSPLDMDPLSREDMENVVFQLGGQKEVDLLYAEKENSFQYHLAGVGYLRCSGLVKMNSIALAIRLIPEEPLPFDTLDLPAPIQDICRMHRGLFLVCGVTGSGKSTTLASLVDMINQERSVHIVTVEDPIEFVYTEKKSIISQRQVGRDTHSFANAIRGAMREDPDVILVGEMRDRDTIRTALSAAATGHLVFSTLHTTTAVDTVNRIISFFPNDERDVIRQELAYSLVGVCCQRLLRRKEGGRIPCVELLLCNLPMIRDAILEGEIERLHNIIEVDSQMHNFDQYAVDLYKKDIVTREEAISACADEESFKRVTTGIKGSEGRRLLK